MQPVLSICLPTCNRPELVVKGIESILNQGVEDSLYEIVVSDDSEGDETEKIIQKYLSLPNIKYQHVKHITSFMNLDLALSMGTGCVLKLFNDYSTIIPGHLSEMIELVKNHTDDEAQIVFAMGNQKFDGVKEYSSFDELLFDLGYWETWVGNFSMWKEDYDRCKSVGYEINEMFPHTSLLHFCSDKKSYVIDNRKHFDSAKLKKKGGYNLPETFGENYLTLVQKSFENGEISDRTREKIRTEILNFIAGWAVTTKYESDTFQFKFDNAIEHLSKVYAPDEIEEYKKLVCEKERNYRLKHIIPKPIKRFVKKILRRN